MPVAVEIAIEPSNEVEPGPCVAVPSTDTPVDAMPRRVLHVAEAAYCDRQRAAIPRHVEPPHLNSVLNVLTGYMLFDNHDRGRLVFLGKVFLTNDAAGNDVGVF